MNRTPLLHRFSRLTAIALIGLVLPGSFEALAQCSFASGDCTSNIAAGSTNFNALTWTHVSGPACPTGGSTSYGGNLALAMANGTTLVVTSDFTINGDFKITNSGTNAVINIPVGVTFHVTADMGDCSNNNVDFVVNGTLIVDGYISGRNNNSFSGSGSITAGGLRFNNNVSCPSCTLTWNVGTCQAAGAPGATFCTLPIQLSSFQAEVKANGTHLRWTTESETHVDYLTLQKSTDGVVFRDLANFPGNGNAQERRTYSYLDEHLLIGRSYYRVRETDLDGTQLYHRIISVDYTAGRMLDLYPVPVTEGILHLRTNFQPGSDTRVILSDLTGSVLQESILRTGEPMNVPVKLQAGLYLITFISGDFRMVKRFVVR